MKAQYLHAKAIEVGFGGNVFLGNALIDMYIKWGLIMGLIMGLMEMCFWETLCQGFENDEVSDSMLL